MPTIGWFEILIVVAIAIVVLGPKDFPVMLKKAGSWIGTAKRYVSNIQNEVSNLEIDDEKINENVKKETKKAVKKDTLI
jgi:sec-independent protein translocase protein TatB